MRTALLYRRTNVLWRTSCGCAQLRHQSGTTPPVNYTALDRAVTNAVKGRPLPGISIAIVARGDAPILYRSYGLASLDDQDLTKCTPVTEKTTFPVGSSILKNFVAMIIMQLQAENRLSLDDPLSKVLPDVPIQCSALIPEGATAHPPLCIRHLLSHTSGIREYRNARDVLGFTSGLVGSKQTRDVSLSGYYTSSTIKTTTPPGQAFIKSHHNYGLLALVAERVTGKELSLLLHDRLFSPLGMRRTGLVPTPLMEPLTQSFTWKRDGFHGIPRAKRWDAGSGRPMGVGSNVFASAQDMAKYVRLLVDPLSGPRGVLSDDMLTAMLTPQYQRDPFLPAQGLSFAVESASLPHPANAQSCIWDECVGYVTCGQGMSWAGYQSAIVFSRGLGVGAVALTNAGSDSYELSAVAAAALQEGVRRFSFRGKEAPRPLVGPAGALSRTPDDDVIIKAMGNGTSGYEAAALWPKVCGIYQVPRNQLSARVLWTLGGEVQVYQEGGRLQLRALWGPLRTKLFTKDKGLLLEQAEDCHPLHFTVASSRQVLSTPVRGRTDVAFDIHKQELHIGLTTLKKQPGYRSIRNWLMALLAYQAVSLVGRGKALDIVMSMMLMG